MENKYYFFSIFLALLITSFIGFTNIFANSLSSDPDSLNSINVGSLAINKWDEGWQVGSGASKIVKGPLVAPSDGQYCYLVQDDTSFAIFVPTKTQSEIDTFLANHPSNVSAWSDANTYTTQGSYSSSANSWGSFDYNCDGVESKFSTLWTILYQPAHICCDVTTCAIYNLSNGRWSLVAPACGGAGFIVHSACVVGLCALYGLGECYLYSLAPAVQSCI
jgi:hypothetical protein